MLDRATHVLESDQSMRAVLLVDDNPVMLRCLKRALSDCPRPVITCTSPREALKEIATGRVDVIISDIAMPEMSGLELLRRAHALDLDLPVILLTGVPCIDTAAEAVEHGAFAYLLKPVGAERLLSTIARASNAYAAIRERKDLHLKSTACTTEVRQQFEAAMASVWLAYQPIVRLTDRTIVGYEALLRSDHPSLSDPEMILGAAEVLAAMNRVGRRVREQTARDLLTVPAALSFFVNLHPEDLLDDELIRADSLFVAMAPRIVLEITERAGLSTVPDVHSRIKQLRQLGFRIAVDDLGAGYSSLSNVAVLEPEYVKLDMSLVRNVELSGTKQKIVSSIMSMATAMGTEVIAEGIETKGESNALLELGCTLLQGFLLGKPERKPTSVDWTCLSRTEGGTPGDSETQLAPSGVHLIQSSEKERGHSR